MISPCLNVIRYLFICDFIHLKQALDFAINVVDGFEVAENKTRVGLISYSASSQLVFDFNRYSDKSSVNNAIRNAPKAGQGTNTHLALQQAKDVLLQISSGMR